MNAWLCKFAAVGVAASPGGAEQRAAARWEDVDIAAEADLVA